jgi:hypothetical protein
MIGRDLVQRPEEKYIIDFFGLREKEAKEQYPNLYQIIYNKVKPERDQKKRKSNREIWWIYAEARSTMRPAIESIPRYIATCRTAKHRIFSFLSKATLPDAKLVAIGLEGAYYLGVLSSKIHLLWALRTGAFLEDRPNYNHSDCFGKFPFPAASDAQKAHIRELGEALDAHRKRQQSQHPNLTLTNLYNILEKVRAEEALNAKEKEIHEQGLVSILKQLHDDLDAAVFDAYGWNVDLSDEEILQKLVDLNAERAAEEAQGQIRWLRPEYQAPDEVQHRQPALMEMTDSTKETVTSAEKQLYPDTLKDCATAIRALLAAFTSPVSVEDVAAGFKGRRTQKRINDIAEILDMLLALGQIREEDGKYSAN